MAIVVADLLARLRGDTKDFDDKISKADQRFKKLGHDLESLGTRMSLGVTAPLTALGVQAVRIAGDFEQSLNVMQGVTRATGAEMAKVSALAKQLGADMSLPATSATTAAQAMNQLSKAGLTLEHTMQAARGTLQLAAAAGIDAGRAADITAGQLNAFRLSGDQAGRVADLLAGAASNAQGEITDMAVGFQQASAVFANAGQRIEDLTTAMTIMAKAGIQGSDAGTSLRTMILRLQNPTKEANAVLKALGVRLYDAQGRLVPFRSLVDQFSKRLGNVTQEQRNWALSTIFGADAIRAAQTVLVRGTQAWDQNAKAVGRAGSAAEQAAARNRGLKGALDAMRSAFETAANEAITPFIKDLASLAKRAGELFNAFAQLPEPVRKTIVVVAALTAAIGPAVLIAGQLITSVMTLKAALPALGLALKGVAAFMAGPWGLAIAGALTVLTVAWNENWGGLQTKSQGVLKAISADFKTAVGDWKTALSQLEKDPTFQWVKRLWKQAGGVTGAHVQEMRQPAAAAPPKAPGIWERMTGVTARHINQMRQQQLAGQPPGPPMGGGICTSSRSVSESASLPSFRRSASRSHRPSKRRKSRPMRG